MLLLEPTEEEATLYDWADKHCRQVYNILIENDRFASNVMEKGNTLADESLKDALQLRRFLLELIKLLIRKYAPGSAIPPAQD